MRKQKKPKYLKILELVDERPVITLEKCQKRHPEVSSSTFHSTLNTLAKHDMVKKTHLNKKRMAYYKTSKFTLVEAGNVLSDKHESLPSRKTEKPAKRKQLFNPILTMSVYSLLNAFEFFQKGEERHRQATIILMDLAVEYVLKAKLYKTDPVRFLESQLEQLDLFGAIREVKKECQISKEKELELSQIHNARNYAQHRARIPDSPTTRQHMTWAYSFIHEFVQDNFAIDIDAQIPQNLLRVL